MDEDVIPELIERKNEICGETYEQEVNNMLPRLQKLKISDDKFMDLSFNSTRMPCFSMDINSVNYFKADLITDSNEVSSMLMSNSSGNISINEGTKAAADSRMSLYGASSKHQTFSTNIPIDTQFQHILHKMSTNGEINMFSIQQKEGQILDENKEVEVSDEKPIDLSVKRIVDYSNGSGSNSSVSETKDGIQPLMRASEETKRKDPDTGELLETVNIIPPESQGHDGIPNALEQNAGEMDNDIIFDDESSKRSYSADISSDEQSHASNGIITDFSQSSEDTTTASFAEKSSRKISVFVPPIAGMSEIRQRRFSILQPQTPNMSGTEAKKINSSSDEDSKNLCTIQKGSPRNSKRKSKKIAISSPISTTLNPSDLKNDEEKRPSPCKRKKVSSENLAETAGKLRKRSLSEQHNSEGGKKTRLIIRSKSLSPGSKNILSTSSNILLTKISIIPQSRKRTYSDSLNVGHAKCRKSSSSSEDNKNE